MESESKYLEVTDANAAALLAKNPQGNIAMLNLLRFRPVADYSVFPDLAPNKSITGAEAYERYIEHTLPFLHESGGRVLFHGTGGEYLIGPVGSGWDSVLLILQSNLESFMSFASDQAYLKGVGHRTAALEDSRLLPITNIRKHKQVKHR